MNDTKLANTARLRFYEVFGAVHPIGADTIAFLTDKLDLVTIARGDLLVASGQHCNHLYFVYKGVLRGFVQQENKEITTWITSEDELVTSISSYYKQIPSIENIEALEECVLLSLHRDDMEYMYSHFPEVNTIVRTILERYYQDAEERAYVSRLNDATAKYHRFINTKSHLLNRIPLKYVASFLGMTLETLSRIRSRLSHSNRP